MKYLGEGVDGLIAHAMRRPCLLCGGEAAIVGLFIVEGEEAAAFGAAPGKTRIIPYPLCDAHELDAETTARAESLLAAELALEAPTILPAEAVGQISFFAVDHS